MNDPTVGAGLGSIVANLPEASPKFSILGIIVLAILVWSVAQSVTGEAQKVMNLFLLVLLTSMILFNWSKVSQYIFKTKG